MFGEISIANTNLTAILIDKHFLCGDTMTTFYYLTNRTPFLFSVDEQAIFWDVFISTF